MELNEKLFLSSVIQTLFININLKYFCQIRLLERRRENMNFPSSFLFSFTYPINMLQIKGWIFCALGMGDVSVPESHIHFLWCYSTHTSHLWTSTVRTKIDNSAVRCSAKRFDMFVPVCLLCIVRTWALLWKRNQSSTATNKDSLAQLPSIDSQLKTPFF